MSADLLLSKLDGVKRTGPETWLAHCPAHDDAHPSLSIRETDDGKTLIKCWVGCEAHEIVDAVGLRLDDLFPDRPSHHGKPERRPFPAADVLRAVGREALLVAVSASRLGNGGILTDVDRARLLLAAQRLAMAIEGSGHGRG
jgi:hypothetical protein